MKTYKVSVVDSFDSREYEADINANSCKAAIVEAKEYYAYELDTTADYLRIVGCVELLTA